MVQAFWTQYKPGALVSAAISSEEQALGKLIKIDWKMASSEAIKLIQDATAAYKSKHPQGWDASPEKIKQAAGFFLSYLIGQGHKDAKYVSLIAESTLDRTFDCDMFVLKLADFLMGIGVPPTELRFVHIAPSKQSYEPHKLLKAGGFYLDMRITDVYDADRNGKKGKKIKTEYEMLVLTEKEVKEREDGRRVEIEPWRQSERLNRSGILDRINLLLMGQKDEYDKIRAQYRAGQDNLRIFEKMRAALDALISTAYAGVQVADAYCKDEPENDDGFWRAGQNYLQMAHGYSIFESTSADKRHYAGEAVKWLQKAIAVNSKNADSYMLLAEAHALLGDTGKAGEEYQTALDLMDPHDPSVRQIKDWLKKNRKK